MVTTGQMQLLRMPQERQTSDDYYTPRHVFDRMGIEFDMDVASPDGGSPWVPAKRCLTIEDDGLSTPWQGRVWMNPPYSKPAPWASKFVAHGHGIALLPWAKSAWCYQLWRDVDAIAMDNSGYWPFMGGHIFMPVFFAAMGDDCVDAIGELGGCADDCRRQEGGEMVKALIKLGATFAVGWIVGGLTAIAWACYTVLRDVEAAA